MGGYLMTAPGIVGMVIGFLLLDERDAHTLTALRVTPLSIRGYLAYRLTMPLLLATASTMLGYVLIGFAPLPFSALLAISAVGALSAPLLTLVLATAAPNKVAGLAVVKVLNGLNLLPVAAFFLPMPLQYVAGIIPTYWPMRALWSAAAARATRLTSSSVRPAAGCSCLGRVLVRAKIGATRMIRHTHRADPMGCWLLIIGT